jgi:dTDP-4-dehydrorhamnose reductase
LKVLIIGGSSLLGRYLVQTKPKSYITESTWYTNPADCNYQLDVTNKSQVSYIFDRVRPDLVIHCAAIGNVDFAEQNYQVTRAVNVDGTKNIIDLCNDYKAKLIYISTNAVYEGVNPPYSESSPQNPVNVYGSIKKQAERVVQDLAKNWLIIRPFMLYGWPYSGGRSNWAIVIKERLESGENTKLVNDVIWQPTYAKEAVITIWILSKIGNEESYNIASPDRMTLYEFGLKVAETWNLDKSLLELVDSDYFPTIARRPKDTSYDLKKLNGVGIDLMSVEQGLEMMKAERE